MNDTILCHDKEDAKRTIDNIGGHNVKDWEFLANGKVLLILNGSRKEHTNDSAN